MATSIVHRTNNHVHAVPQTRVTIVTPEIAQCYLNSNIANNRRISQDRVKVYANQMQCGEWIFNGDPIRFNDKGELIDGQHRLSAIVLSNVPVKCLIISGLPHDAIHTIDVGKKRSLPDILTMEYGISHRATHKMGIATALLIPFNQSYNTPFAVARTRNLTEKDKIDIFFANQEAIEFSLKEFGTISPNSNDIKLPFSCRSVIARAYRHENHQNLLRFIEVASTGLHKDESEFGATTLYKYLTGIRKEGKREDTFVVFQKTQNALRAFLTKTPIKFLKSSNAKYSRVKDGIFWLLDSDKPFIEEWERKQQRNLAP